MLTFDRLSRRCLGCYGHEWIETPNLDRLASRGLVFDQHFVSPDRSAEHAWHLSFWPQLVEAGIDVRQLVEPAVEVDDSTLEKLPLAILVAMAESELAKLAQDTETRWLLWVTSAGIAWPCVAFDTFAELYADELSLDEDSRPECDEVREAEVAYAACVTQLDHLIGQLLDSIERLFGDDPPLLIVTALAGESLGESEQLPLSHLNSAPPESAAGLRDELVHTPLLIAHATRDRSSGRQQELTQADDLLPTLCDWFGLDPAVDTASDGRSLLPLMRHEPTAWRDSLVLLDVDESAALRTRDCLLVRPDSTGEIAPKLYLKPEDTWEVNDIAEQSEDRVADLTAQLKSRLATR